VASLQPNPALAWWPFNPCHSVSMAIPSSSLALSGQHLCSLLPSSVLSMAPVVNCLSALRIFAMNQALCTLSPIPVKHHVSNRFILEKFFVHSYFFLTVAISRGFSKKIRMNRVFTLR